MAATTVADLSAASPRILGLGVGLFFLLALGLLFALIAVLTSKSNMFGGIVMVLLLLYSILIMVLALTPKVSPGEQYSYPDKVDNTYYGKIVFLSFMLIFGAVAGVVSLVSCLFTPRLAKNPDDED